METLTGTRMRMALCHLMLSLTTVKPHYFPLCVDFAILVTAEDADFKLGTKVECNRSQPKVNGRRTLYRTVTLVSSGTS